MNTGLKIGLATAVMSLIGPRPLFVRTAYAAAQRVEPVADATQRAAPVAAAPRENEPERC